MHYENLAPQHVGDGSEVYAEDRPQWDKWIGNTRTGTPSDWREHWSEETEAAWQKAGGVELLDRAGYGSHLWTPEQVAA
jgi:hypothetical protein